ncbi:D-sedoheptulose-7-phosphate isomerase [Qaidamihabitans albus]|uniref:D-sedoheptulose-7-phosphate isomerase n=1 Tax=Qaidamihabitans albus TaxID=2795733 RepID=UPI0018F17821|nr:SIS domain-containing protein [Qaidamihabitans albus]
MTSHAEHPDLASLYPFLYSGEDDVDGVLAEARQSTIDKTREIIDLRRQVRRQDGARLAACGAAMAERFASGGRLFAFGNGGSSTDAQDLATTFMDPPQGTAPMPAFALTADIAVITALSNDVGFDVVFSRQLAAFARPHDIAVGLSTSGNSANLLSAFDEASRRGMLTVGISGHTGGKMAELDSIDYLFVVPSPSVHRIQEAQTTVYHVLAELAADGLPGGHPFDAGGAATPEART